LVDLALHRWPEHLGIVVNAAITGGLLWVGGRMDKVNLSQKFSLFASHWDPKIVGGLRI